MSVENAKTLRLVMPQWQGGNNHAYYLGSQLLNWLAPEATGPVEHVDVVFDENLTLENENGIVGRSLIVPQLRHSKELIEKHNPESLVVFGGDCLVDLAPFAYLSEKYGDDLGVLWVDAHPDIMTSEQFEHSHASVLRALMGEGDADLTQFVSTPIKANKVMYAGVNNENEYEQGFLKERDMRICRPEEIRGEITSIQKWIEEENIKVLAIHFDLDVLSIADFRSLLFANPHYPDDAFEGIAQGQITMAEALKVIHHAAGLAEVVGIGIAEHLPWDAINMKNMLSQLPLIGSK